MHLSIIETQSTLECVDEMGLKVALQALRGLLRQLHLGRERKGRVTGTQSQNRLALKNTGH